MYPQSATSRATCSVFDFPVPLFSFGLMVALAILTATAMTRVELDRRFALGWVDPVRAKVKDDKGRERVQLTSPSALLWNMALMAGFFGVLGAKLFHIIDYWDEFVQDPFGMFFSGSGLTVYGGILLAGLAILWYARRKGLNGAHLADSVAPGLMLAYGIGRIGCYLSGDGDWGVCSSLADKPGWNSGLAVVRDVPPQHAGRGRPGPLQRPSSAGPSARSPTRRASTRPWSTSSRWHAVLAGVLWALRKNPFKAGWLISLYAVFAGIERFLIEFIRVNPDAAFGLPQSQIISVRVHRRRPRRAALTTRRVHPQMEPAAA